MSRPSPIKEIDPRQFHSFDIPKILREVDAFNLKRAGKIDRDLFLELGNIVRQIEWVNIGWKAGQQVLKGRKIKKENLSSLFEKIDRLTDEFFYFIIQTKTDFNNLIIISHNLALLLLPSLLYIYENLEGDVEKGLRIINAQVKSWGIQQYKPTVVVDLKKRLNQDRHNKELCIYLFRNLLYLLGTKPSFENLNDRVKWIDFLNDVLEITLSNEQKLSWANLIYQLGSSDREEFLKAQKTLSGHLLQLIPGLSLSHSEFDEKQDLVPNQLVTVNGNFLSQANELVDQLVEIVESEEVSLPILSKKLIELGDFFGKGLESVSVEKGIFDLIRRVDRVTNKCFDDAVKDEAYFRLLKCTDRLAQRYIETYRMPGFSPLIGINLRAKLLTACPQDLSDTVYLELSDDNNHLVRRIVHPLDQQLSTLQKTSVSKQRTDYLYGCKHLMMAMRDMFKKNRVDAKEMFIRCVEVLVGKIDDLPDSTLKNLNALLDKVKNAKNYKKFSEQSSPLIKAFMSLTVRSQFEPFLKKMREEGDSFGVTQIEIDNLVALVNGSDDKDEERQIFLSVFSIAEGLTEIRLLEQANQFLLSGLKLPASVCDPLMRIRAYTILMSNYADLNLSGSVTELTQDFSEFVESIKTRLMDGLINEKTHIEYKGTLLSWCVIATRLLTLDQISRNVDIALKAIFDRTNEILEFAKTQSDLSLEILGLILSLLNQRYLRRNSYSGSSDEMIALFNHVKSVFDRLEGSVSFSEFDEQVVAVVGKLIREFLCFANIMRSIPHEAFNPFCDRLILFLEHHEFLEEDGCKGALRLIKRNEVGDEKSSDNASDNLGNSLDFANYLREISLELGVDDLREDEAHIKRVRKLAGRVNAPSSEQAKFLCRASVQLVSRIQRQEPTSSLIKDLLELSEQWIRGDSTPAMKLNLFVTKLFQQAALGDAEINELFNEINQLLITVSDYEDASDLILNTIKLAFAMEKEDPDRLKLVDAVVNLINRNIGLKDAVSDIFVLIKDLHVNDLESDDASQLYSFCIDFAKKASDFSQPKTFFKYFIEEIDRYHLFKDYKKMADTVSFLYENTSAVQENISTEFCQRPFCKDLVVKIDHLTSELFSEDKGLSDGTYLKLVKLGNEFLRNIFNSGERIDSYLRRVALNLKTKMIAGHIQAYYDIAEQENGIEGMVKFVERMTKINAPIESLEDVFFQNIRFLLLAAVNLLSLEGTENQSNARRLRAAFVKGAKETFRGMFREIPDDFKILERLESSSDSDAFKRAAESLIKRLKEFQDPSKSDEKSNGESQEEKRSTGMLWPTQELRERLKVLNFDLPMFLEEKDSEKPASNKQKEFFTLCDLLRKAARKDEEIKRIMEEAFDASPYPKNITIKYLMGLMTLTVVINPSLLREDIEKLEAIFGFLGQEFNDQGTTEFLSSEVSALRVEIRDQLFKTFSTLLKDNVDDAERVFKLAVRFSPTDNLIKYLVAKLNYFSTSGDIDKASEILAKVQSLRSFLNPDLTTNCVLAMVVVLDKIISSQDEKTASIDIKKYFEFAEGLSTLANQTGFASDRISSSTGSLFNRLKVLNSSVGERVLSSLKPFLSPSHTAQAGQLFQKNDQEKSKLSAKFKKIQKPKEFFDLLNAQVKLIDSKSDEAFETMLRRVEMVLEAASQCSLSDENSKYMLNTVKIYLYSKVLENIAQDTELSDITERLVSILREMPNFQVKGIHEFSTGFLPDAKKLLVHSCKNLYLKDRKKKIELLRMMRTCGFDDPLLVVDFARVAVSQEIDLALEASALIGVSENDIRAIQKDQPPFLELINEFLSVGKKLEEKNYLQKIESELTKFFYILEKLSQSKEKKPKESKKQSGDTDHFETLKEGFKTLKQLLKEKVSAPSTALPLPQGPQSQIVLSEVKKAADESLPSVASLPPKQVPAVIEKKLPQARPKKQFQSKRAPKQKSVVSNLSVVFKEEVPKVESLQSVVSQPIDKKKPHSIWNGRSTERLFSSATAQVGIFKAEQNSQSKKMNSDIPIRILPRPKSNLSQPLANASLPAKQSVLEEKTQAATKPSEQTNTNSQALEVLKAVSEVAGSASISSQAEPNLSAFDRLLKGELLPLPKTLTQAHSASSQNTETLKAAPEAGKPVNIPNQPETTQAILNKPQVPEDNIHQGQGVMPAVQSAPQEKLLASTPAFAPNVMETDALPVQSALLVQSQHSNDFAAALMPMPNQRFIHLPVRVNSIPMPPQNPGQSVIYPYRSIPPVSYSPYGYAVPGPQFFVPQQAAPSSIQALQHQLLVLQNQRDSTRADIEIVDSTEKDNQVQFGVHKIDHVKLSEYQSKLNLKRAKLNKQLVDVEGKIRLIQSQLSQLQQQVSPYFSLQPFSFPPNMSGPQQ